MPKYITREKYLFFFPVEVEVLDSLVLEVVVDLLTRAIDYTLDLVACKKLNILQFKKVQTIFKWQKNVYCSAVVVAEKESIHEFDKIERIWVFELVIEQLV